MNGAALGAYAVISGYRSAHAFGAVFGKALNILAGVKGCVRKQQRGRFSALTAAAVPADLYDVFHCNFLLFDLRQSRSPRYMKRGLRLLRYKIITLLHTL